MRQKMGKASAEPMVKQVSALNTFWLITYIEDHYPNIKPDDILNSVHANAPYYVENLKSGEIEKVSLTHLMDTEYWFSNSFMIDL